MANAHDFITSFSDGYLTQVGDKGSQLSGYVVSGDFGGVAGYDWHTYLSSGIYFSLSSPYPLVQWTEAGTSYLAILAAWTGMICTPVYLLVSLSHFHHLIPLVQRIAIGTSYLAAWPDMIGTPVLSSGISFSL